MIDRIQVARDDDGLVHGCLPNASVWFCGRRVANAVKPADTDLLCGACQDDILSWAMTGEEPSA